MLAEYASSLSNLTMLSLTCYASSLGVEDDSKLIVITYASKPNDYLTPTLISHIRQC